MSKIVLVPLLLLQSFFITFGVGMFVETNYIYSGQIDNIAVRSLALKTAQCPTNQQQQCYVLPQSGFPFVFLKDNPASDSNHIGNLSILDSDEFNLFYFVLDVMFYFFLFYLLYTKVLFNMSQTTSK